jgi:hypothetical protein
VPWIPELFSASVRERLERKWELERLDLVPYYDGLMSGEHAALTRSFAGEPVLHDPRRGRVIGVQAFEAYVRELGSWLSEHNMSFDPVDHVFMEPRASRKWSSTSTPRGRARGSSCRHRRRPSLRRATRRAPDLPQHLGRDGSPPASATLLQRNPDLRAEGVVAEYQRALAAGDVDAVIATFEPGGYAREPAGREFLHRGGDDLRAFYERLFSNGGGIELEHCGLVHDGRACALEYNVVGWGKTELPPEAGVAVYVQGESGQIAAARIYDDADPPIS